MIDGIRRGQHEGGVTWRRYADVKLLLLLDLETLKPTDWALEQLDMIVCDRYDDLRPTVFATSQPVDQLADVIGERLVHKLATQASAPVALL